MRTKEQIQAFDRDHAAALRRLWFAGDVHNNFRGIYEALSSAERSGNMPAYLIFLGDLDLEGKSLAEHYFEAREIFEDCPRWAYIPGNHDGDTHDKLKLLNSAPELIDIHGTVVTLEGIRIAGLGGNFQGKVWYPPEPPACRTHKEVFGNRPTRQLPKPSLHVAIVPEVYDRLRRMKADVLITHEAFSCHHHGWEVLDELAREMRVFRAFHGHTHDDQSDQYLQQFDRLKFDARAVNGMHIKNGLGELVFEPPEIWRYA